MRRSTNLVTIEQNMDRQASEKGFCAGMISRFRQFKNLSNPIGWGEYFKNNKKLLMLQIIFGIVR